MLSQIHPSMKRLDSCIEACKQRELLAQLPPLQANITEVSVSEKKDSATIASKRQERKYTCWQVIRGSSEEITRRSSEHLEAFWSVSKRVEASWWLLGGVLGRLGAILHRTWHSLHFHEDLGFAAYKDQVCAVYAFKHLQAASWNPRSSLWILEAVSGTSWNALEAFWDVLELFGSVLESSAHS